MRTRYTCGFTAPYYKYGTVRYYRFVTKPRKQQGKLLHCNRGLHPTSRGCARPIHEQHSSPTNAAYWPCSRSSTHTRMGRRHGRIWRCDPAQAAQATEAGGLGAAPDQDDRQPRPRIESVVAHKAHRCATR